MRGWNFTNLIALSTNPIIPKLMTGEFDWEMREDAAAFTSGSQKARVWTEGWVLRQMYCPSCGERPLTDYTNNKPVADFYCGLCSEDYELKSTKGKFGKKITDGAYATMMARLQSETVPSLMLLRYTMSDKMVQDLSVIPKQFFVTDLIERRKPLAETARRAGWVGCNILIDKVPKAGRISLVKNRIPQPKDRVLDKWAKTRFLRGKTLDKKGWVLDVLNCVEHIGQTDFTLGDVYKFENYLSELHPENNNVKPKIRQQLQVLRDAGILEFVRRGEYRVI
jgi:type II restriction enzyme